MDSFYQSSSPGQLYYEPEMMRYGCVKEKNTQLVADPRFTRSGIYSNDYDIEVENGVFAIIQTQPSIYRYINPLTMKQSWAVGSWNRPTIQWSLECEASGKTREMGYEAVQT